MKNFATALKMSSKLSKRAAASSADIAQTDFAAYGPRYPLPDESAVAHSRQTREDLAGAFSGYGHTGYCPEGIPVEQAIFGILAAFAASLLRFSASCRSASLWRRRKIFSFSYPKSVAS